MKALDIIDEHIIIRETVGYNFLKDIEVSDLPQVIDFLKILYNYNRMTVSNSIEKYRRCLLFYNNWIYCKTLYPICKSIWDCFP